MKHRNKPEREFASLTRERGYKSTLVTFGLASRDVTEPEAFNVWTRVCSDLRLQTKNISLECALAAMSGAELRALRVRVERWPNQ